ncbi:MAG: phosphotransferase [Patulibacter sp.]
MFMPPAGPRAAQLARVALRHYDFSPRTTIELWQDAPLAGWKLHDPDTDEHAVLRVHPAGHRYISEINSELVWLDALLAARVIDVPPPISARNGSRVVTVEDDDGLRCVTVCGWVTGTPLTCTAESLGQLGAVAARLHEHAAHWRLPPGFCRRPWQPASRPGIDPGCSWSWRPVLADTADAEAVALLARAAQCVAEQLVGYDRSRAAYGLVHGQLHAGNLLVDDRASGPAPRVIGFGNCGPGWLMLDAAAAIVKLDDPASLDAQLAAWCDGYRTVRPLPVRLEHQVPALVMDRWLTELGWGATIPAAPVDRARTTIATACEFAEQYLAGVRQRPSAERRTTHT